MAHVRRHDLLLSGGGDNIVRLLPPLNLAEAKVLEIGARIEATCADLTNPA